VNKNLNCEESNRESKVRKILAILAEFVNSTESLFCLDIGCGNGAITHRVASHFKTTIGLDHDWKLIQKANKHRLEPALSFINSNGAYLPFASGVFDVILFTQVYEHTSSPDELVNQIWLKLKPGGICFFSGPNKWALMEEHYWLPFLSWLPRSLASFYMRLFRGGQKYDIYSKSYWQLQKMLERFEIKDQTTAILRNPTSFAIDDRFGLVNFISKFPTWLHRILTPFIPNFNWVLIKPS
jgi:2-polyprenyl-3-methyl-5-hydroxy-6-metoxy-1,4-benzoquinol methylase